MDKKQLEELYRLTEHFNEADDIMKVMNVLVGKNGTKYCITHRDVIVLFQTIVMEMIRSK